MNQNLAKKIAQKELKRRNVKPINVLEQCLSYQLAFILDPHKRKAICGTRRAAKSYAIALALINQAVTIPKSKCIYMGLTNESCKAIMWTDIIETIFDKYSIQAELNSKYEIEFDNGSTIFLRGLDATPHQMSRLRGNKFDIAAIDEIQDFTQDIETIIDGVLKMTLAQTGATLILGGTPGNNQGSHYWFQVNKPNSELTQWKLFHFNWKDNISIEPKSGLRVCDAIQATIDADIQRNPLIRLTTKFRQEVLGEWVIDSDARVYKIQPHNMINELPFNLLKGATYILSIDLGYYDATAFVIGLYNKRFDSNLYIIESFKQTKLTISAVANFIKELKKKYNFTFHIVDSANAQAVEEMRQIYSLPLIAADKLGKEAHIALANSDFTTGNVRILRQTNLDLVQELETLIWDQKQLLQGKHKENASKENHLCDSFLYCHHFSRHFWFKKPEDPIEPEEQIILDIEKQVGFNKPKLRTFKKPFWENEDY